MASHNTTVVMASTEAPSEDVFVNVKTSLPRTPLPSLADRPIITTERLAIRAFKAYDLDALYELRTQPEVMRWTSTGRVDQSKEETKAKLDLFMPPNDAKTYNFAICLKETGELIGMGGSHQMVSSLGWPEVGYMIKEKYWGQGYTPEFLHAWLKAWDGLPREEVELRVDPRSVVPVDGKEGSSREMCIAVTEESNDKSQMVLRKCGFEHFLTWIVEEAKSGEDTVKVVLPSFRRLREDD